tara:strand:+ start:7811 stop:8674 length:864 start_codon:yes stop_codon:yes gene_type:complete
MLWFDHFLLKRGEAYRNLSDVPLAYYSDSQLDSDYVAYASPYKQWVFDSDVPGANIVDTATVGGNQWTRATSDNGGGVNPKMSVDYLNGRILFNSALGDGLNALVSSVAVKDFNIYATDESEESLVVEDKYDTNSRFFEAVTPIDPYKQVVPAIFIANQGSRNEPIAFGGMDNTLTIFRCVVFAENLYQLDGALSVFNDSKGEAFYQVGYDNHPIDEFGDVKSSINSVPTDNIYKYSALPFEEENSPYIISSVTVSKLSDKINTKISPNLFIGFIDMEVSKFRYPRQ